MVLTPSIMAQLGRELPRFSLRDASGKMVSSADYADAPALLIVFLCSHCPYVMHIRGGLAELARAYAERGVAIVGVNANDTVYKVDHPDRMAAEAAEAGYSFPYLHDADQSFAREIGAACTPDFFLYDGDRRLVYRGQFDDSRPKSDIPVTGSDLRDALDAVLAGNAVSGDQKASIGCNIKWRRDAAPDHFRPGISYWLISFLQRLGS